jgi:hypothetical protein
LAVFVAIALLAGCAGWLFGGAGVLGFLLTTSGTCLYLLPSVLGWHKKNRAAIIALNLLLGWTLLGWVGALVWALMKERQ